MDTVMLAVGVLVVLVVLGALVMLLLRRKGASDVASLPSALEPIEGTSLAESQQARELETMERYPELTGVGWQEAKNYVDAPPLKNTSHSSAAQGTLAEVQRLMQQGQKIQAIKLYREISGVGLKEAKDFVETMPLTGSPFTATPPAPSPPTASNNDLSEVQRLARLGQKIQAIKLYRELTGLGLKEAKDFVDQL